MRRWQDLGPEERLAHRLIAELDAFDVDADETVSFRELRRIFSSALETLDDDLREGA